MKIILLFSLAIFSASCSHHHKSTVAHHHDKKSAVEKYDKKCAHSVSEGNLHVEGKEEFKLEHGGETYYFSSEEKMKEFKEDLGPNVSRADKKWKKAW